jgi:outer membrane protein TolC
MKQVEWSGRRWGAFVLGVLVLSLSASWPTHLLAAQEPGTPVGTTVPPVQAMALDLGSAIQLALERQPALAAQRASLAAAQVNCRALDNIRVPALIAPELPVRRKQAHIGVGIAAAGVDQVEHETVYAVTRTYYSVVFAREQERVASGVVDHFRATLETAQRLVQGGSRDVTTSSVDKTTVYLKLAQVRREEARTGVERALAALREAIGVGPESMIDIATERLPDVPASVSRDEVIALALARRGEMVSAAELARVTCLEVCAQGKSHHVNFHTYASVVDIHGRQVPQGVADGEYRPGAVPPEMPTFLAGSRADRQDRARAFASRANDVTDKTRNLIALEAEDAFLRWQEYSRRVPDTTSAAEIGTRLADNTRKDFGGEQRVKVEDVLANEVLAAQARASRNEALYHQILALAALERITAGGFNAGLAAAASAAPQTGAAAPTDSNNLQP